MIDLSIGLSIDIDYYWLLSEILIHSVEVQH